MDKLTLTHGPLAATFTHTAQGWTPAWFEEAGRPMLRFKDHEWLAMGHVRPMYADSMIQTSSGGAVFTGSTLYGKTKVAWSVSIEPDTDGPGFVIHLKMTPAESIELLEAGTVLETPYEYAGHETATTVIGMNPVSRWEGAKQITPPTWANPAWIYVRPQSVRITAPANAPFLCQTITNGGDIADRFITVVGDWNVCPIKELFATPTRDVPNTPPSPFSNFADKRGYKYIVGAMNWSSSYAKDPNVLFPGGKTFEQKLIVDFSSSLHGRTLDSMLYKAWERAALLDIPKDGRVVAFDRAKGRNVTWRAATTWLRDVICSDAPTEGLYRPNEGICTYAVGTRPKDGNSGYSVFWWPQWAGLMHYRARMLADSKLQSKCDELDDKLVAAGGKVRYFDGIAVAAAALPTLWWLHGGGRETSVLKAAMEPMLKFSLGQSIEENGKPRKMDYGTEANRAEALLLGADIFNDPGMRNQALVLLDEMAMRLDGNFWEFNVGPAGSLWHGGQIRSLGHGHAIVANLLAYRQTHVAKYLERAHRFARYLLSVSYGTFNASGDPDFDLRGWCNGSNSGRDQIAEAPPWETQNGLLCIGALMNDAELEGGFYDVLWYIGRTGLAQFPAARTLKRILGQDYRPQYVPRNQIASERDFYDCLPYLAYENPHDQTLLASYQGTDCLVGEFVYGSGLASSSDDRLGVVVPRAALLDLRELNQRVADVWNPLRRKIKSTITATWPDGSKSHTEVEVEGRSRVRVVIDRMA